MRVTRRHLQYLINESLGELDINLQDEIARAKFRGVSRHDVNSVLTRGGADAELAMEIAILKAILEEETIIPPRQSSYPAYIFERAYVTNVLGLQIPLNESYPYSRIMEEQILREHLLLEGFFSELKEMGGQVKKFWGALKDIFKNPEKIGSYVGALNKMVIKKMVKPIRSFFTMIKEKLGAIGGKVFDTFAAAADKVLSMLDSVLKKVGGLDGWKQAMGVTALALGMKWVWDQVGELIEEGKEKLEDMIPFLEVAETAAEGALEAAEEDTKLGKAKVMLKAFADWFQDKVIDEVVDFVKEKLKAIATSAAGSALSGGVTKVWEALKSAYGGAKFVLSTLWPAISRFTQKIKAESYEPLREYIQTLLREENDSKPPRMKRQNRSINVRGVFRESPS